MANKEKEQEFIKVLGLERRRFRFGHGDNMRSYYGHEGDVWVATTVGGEKREIHFITGFTHYNPEMGRALWDDPQKVEIVLGRLPTPRGGEISVVRTLKFINSFIPI